jgi:hypothetical protein
MLERKLGWLGATFGRTSDCPLAAERLANPRAEHQRLAATRIGFGLYIAFINNFGLTTMGLLSSLFGGQPKTTKMKVAGLAASTIDFVINDAGLGMLVAGSLVLDKNFQPSFRSGRPKAVGDILAVAAIGDLEEAEIFKALADTDMRDPSLFQPFVDQLIYAVLRQFEAQCPSFAALPTGNMFGE